MLDRVIAEHRDEILERWIDDPKLRLLLTAERAEELRQALIARGAGH